MDFFYTTKELLIQRFSVPNGTRIQLLPPHDLDLRPMDINHIYVGIQAITEEIDYCQEAIKQVLKVFELQKQYEFTYTLLPEEEKKLLEYKHVLDAAPAIQRIQNLNELIDPRVRLPLILTHELTDTAAPFVSLMNQIKPLIGKSMLRIALLNWASNVIGDTLNALRAIQIFRSMLEKQFSTVMIDVYVKSALPEKDLYNLTGIINDHYLMPMSLASLTTYDAVFYVQHRFGNTEFDHIPMIDAFLKEFWIDPAAVHSMRKRLRLPVPTTTPDCEQVLVKLRQSKTHLLLFHPFASTILRTMPTKHLFPMLMALLKQTNYRIVTVKSLMFRDDRVMDLSAYSKGFKELAYIVSQMDAVFCVDTGIYHIAAAYNIPSLVLFHSIHPSLRICYYPQAKGVLLGSEKNSLYGRHKLSRNEVNDPEALDALYQKLDITDLCQQINALLINA